jgi:hypothetical protein
LPANHAFARIAASKPQLVDLNGDGYLDLLDLADDVRRAFGDAGGFRQPELLLMGFSDSLPLQVIDVDGDGKKDLTRIASAVDHQWARNVDAAPPGPPENVSGVTLESRTSSTLSFEWDYSSPIRFFQYLRVKPTPAGSVVRIPWASSQSRYSFAATDLSADTEYCYRVSATSWFGSSTPHEVCGKTLPAAGGGGGDQHTSITMSRQPINQGYVPYAGTFGPISGGAVVTTVSFPTSWPAVLLVKPGHSTNECGDPSAVVSVLGTMTDEQKNAIWGTSNLTLGPAQSLSFVGCTTSTALPNWLPVNLTWHHN